jgi:hypothetical protein
MTKEIDNEIPQANVDVQLNEDNEVISSAISDLSNKLPSTSGIEAKLDAQNELLEKLNTTIHLVSERDSFANVTAYVSVATATIGLVVALVGAYLAYRQFSISARAEKTQIYYEVLNALWYFATYTGRDPENTTEHLQKIHRVQEVSKNVFGNESGEFIQRVLQVIQDLPAQYAAFEGLFGAEVSDALIKLGLDPETAQASLTQKYKENRIWLQRGAFSEFDRIFKI